MQNVAAPLLIGPVFLFFIALLVRSQSSAASPAMPIISYVGVAFAVVDVIVFFTIPRLVGVAASRKAAREAGPEDAPDGQDAFLCGIFQTRLIIGYAMLEGAAFLQGIAYIVEGQLFSLALGLALVLI